MRFVVYLDPEGTFGAIRPTTYGDPIVVDMDHDSRLDDAVAQALDAAGRDVRDRYFFGNYGLIYWPKALRDATQKPAEIIRFPDAVPDSTGELLWTDGARSRVTLSDLARAKEQGLFRGDPAGVFAEQPLGGEAPPGWHELISWLSDVGGVITLAGMLVAVVRKGWEHWKDRGAITPFGFLDLVPARDQWEQQHLETLLGISSADATDLLTSMGYVKRDDTSTVWIVSDDPEKSALRRRIIEDYFHRTYDNPHEERPEAE